jgi:hypothetical protein
LKKPLKIVLPLLLLGLIFSTQNIQAPYNVTLGLYAYDVNDANVTLSFGVNTATVDGFAVAGQDHPSGTAITLNVTSVLADEVKYNITAGTDVESHTTIPGDASFLIDMIYYPINILTIITLNPWNQVAVESLFKEIIMLPFLSVNATTWTDWMHLINNMTAGTLPAGDIDDTINLRAKYVNGTSDFLVEVYYHGAFMENLTDVSVMSSIDVSLEHKYMFAYNKTTGIMYGMQMEGSIDGTANGTLISCNYVYNTEADGYDLPDFDLDKATWPFPGFRLGLAIGVLSSIVFVAVIIRKRK